MDTNSLVLTLLRLNNWGPTKVFNYVKKHNFDYKESLNGLVEKLTDDEKNSFKEKLVDVTRDLDNNYKKGIKCISLFDEQFPKKLYSNGDKCVFLYYIGNIELLNQPAITVIGTRKPSDNFVNKGVIATKYFAQKGYVIVSGLALGCDQIAHRACLDVNGKTIAVLPSPCDKPQPASNKNLANDIINKGGLLISEYGTDDKVTKYNFVERDRIQSLLSNVILVIEANDSSGTMNAVKKNINDKKMVYAIEGNKISIIKKYIDVDNYEQLSEIEKSTI